MTSEVYLAQGAELLKPKLGEAGYCFTITDTARGSGGPFAEGVFKRGDQEIRLRVRHDALGGVAYRAGADEWSHSDYMRAIGRGKEAQYPGFHDGDPFGGFRRLLVDLNECGQFLNGDGRSIDDLVRSMPPRPKGFKALSS
jgi:hypothetical protein